RLAECIQHGSDVDVLTETSEQNIDDAIKHGHSKTISFLLSIGLQVGTADENSPAALKYGRLLIPTSNYRWKDNPSYHLAVVSFLTKKANININAVDCQGNTIIHFAVQLDNMPLLQALLKEHPDTSLPNQNGHTALQLAIEAELPDALTLLQSQNHKRREYPLDHKPVL
ncbi:ankyrin repeat-containing domain protein, partial [Ilyonectria robusta]|uniref:ankyrin repeat-containing domain protein n=1 Tax=Ilyonectria robusta TaxID=1079257 RepID=UPI001E8D217C